MYLKQKLIATPDHEYSQVKYLFDNQDGSPATIAGIASYLCLKEEA